MSVYNLPHANSINYRHDSFSNTENSETAVISPLVPAAMLSPQAFRQTARVKMAELLRKLYFV